MQNYTTLIQSRHAKLEVAKINLKSRFFGLDNIIDRVIDSIRSWYVLPEASNRPTIVCLWGLTGVGKTALIRALAAELGFTDKFVEIQMDSQSNGGEYEGKNSVSSILASSSIEEGHTGIVLLDEFQRFRTIDEDGNTAKVERYQDAWMLLSDGKFAADAGLYSTLHELVTEDMYNKSFMIPDDDEPPTIAASNKKSKKIKHPESVFKQGHWSAKRYKKILKLPEPLIDIMKMSTDQLVAVCQKMIDEKQSIEADYTKTLIFVCGNLDEAYRMTSYGVANVDTDADFFYEMTKDITILDIKAALKKRFAAEQISRLGNNHIIYPSLNKDTYKKIIKAETTRHVQQVKAAFNITFNVANTVYDSIYSNGVYPTQGIRPVFSSVKSIFVSPSTDLLVWAVENNLTDIDISVNNKTFKLIGKGKTSTKKTISKEIDIVLDIDSNKAKQSDDMLTLTCVHEAGHALVHAKLFGITPAEIHVNTAYNAGYVNAETSAVYTSTEFMKNIAVGLAGYVAEEMVFGKDTVSNGVQLDYQSVCGMVACYVRTGGMNLHDNIAMASGNPLEGIVNSNHKDPQVESILRGQLKVAEQTLRSMQPAFIQLVNALKITESMSKEHLFSVLHPYIPELKMQPKNEDVQTEYVEMWNKFANNN